MTAGQILLCQIALVSLTALFSTNGDIDRALDWSADGGGFWARLGQTAQSSTVQAHSLKMRCCCCGCRPMTRLNRYAFGQWLDALTPVYMPPSPRRI